MDDLIAYLRDFAGLEQVLSPVYLLSFVAIGYAIYAWRRETGGFWAFLLPKRIWSHPSVKTDVWLFAVGQLMILFKVGARFAATPLVAAWVVAHGPGPLLQGLTLSPVLMALLLLMITDFSLYWVHRAYHTINTIWPLHAVHHSAAVLTPLTAYRQHPVGILVSLSFNAILIGALYGLIIGSLTDEVAFATIAGANAFIVIVNLLVTNFHHSHIWVSFGPVVERFVISPAQHQVHHSTNPIHFNKNFGQNLAVWDWMFGTLYVTHPDEAVRFGLDAPEDAPLMTQRLGPVLMSPLRRMIGQTP
ncbi:sterol desaturase family protein [Pseudooctadecabacter jejudonensis]|uniref:Fatty acid hydroxylase superfamily protein n=1 Tax=Pseudooctadecabacter jejudonensis TaxID=1391910 RepID=A0A1Y5R7B7_9RHOB|nr:sterol desaturase family protein [Pseudooctadecabacter jejudonensis]SLN10815.1 Fatty acid hydroxylase superfamily protein [Pseudooctadecabacter jejudonensis]